MKVRRAYNPKRRLADLAEFPAEKLQELGVRVVYTGNPQHKSRPNDYGLYPQADPRPGKTLCDGSGPFPRDLAVELLRQGVARRTISMQQRNGWPQNIWSVSGDEDVFEAQLENHEQGHYHGYPMPADDDFRLVVLAAWQRAES